MTIALTCILLFLYSQCQGKLENRRAGSCVDLLLHDAVEVSSSVCECVPGSSECYDCEVECGRGTCREAEILNCIVASNGTGSITCNQPLQTLFSCTQSTRGNCAHVRVACHKPASVLSTGSGAEGDRDSGTTTEQSVCKCGSPTQESSPTNRMQTVVCYDCICEDPQECQLLSVMLDCILSDSTTSMACRTLLLLIYDCTPEQSNRCDGKQNCLSRGRSGRGGTTPLLISSPFLTFLLHPLYSHTCTPPAAQQRAIAIGVGSGFGVLFVIIVIVLIVSLVKWKANGSLCLKT